MNATLRDDDEYLGRLFCALPDHVSLSIGTDLQDGRYSVGFWGKKDQWQRVTGDNPTEVFERALKAMRVALPSREEESR